MKSSRDLLIGLVIGFCAALTVPSVAQTAGQFSQLVSYVGKLASRLLVAEQNLEAERARTKAINVYVRDFACKHNVLVNTVQDVAKATDAVPAKVQVVLGKNCAGDGPAPELPALE